MRAFALTLAAACCLSLPAWAEDLVVIESTLPAFAPGATVKGESPIKLPEKSKLVLVSETGKTVTLTGPYDGKAGQAGGKGGDGKLISALSTLVRSTQEDAQSVGAIRAAGIKTRADALRINLSESGDYCLTSGSPEITRYQSESGAKVTVNAVKGDLKASLDWPKGGINFTGWPASLPIEDGATYLVEQDGKDSRTMLILHMVQDQAPTDAHRAIAMAEQGCMEQAKMLLALLKKGG